MRARKTNWGAAVARRPSVLALTCLVAIITGCASEQREPTRLGAASLVIAASAQDAELDEALFQGAIFLINADGAHSRITTSGMDGAKLLPLGAGVSFSDQQNDYLLGESLTSWKRTQQASLEIGAVTIGSGEVVAAFNQGEDEAGYRTDVATFGSSGSQLTTQLGLTPQGITKCGEDVYLVGAPADQAPHLMAVQAIGKRPGDPLRYPFEPTNWPDRIACLDGRIMSVVADAEAEPDTKGTVAAYLSTIDPQTDRLRLTRLGAGNEIPLRLQEGEADGAVYRVETASEGNLEWVGAGSGRAFRTDPTSGATTVVASGLPTKDNEQAVIRFTPSGCDVLAPDLDGVWVWHKYDDDWALVTKQRLPWLAGELGPMFVYDFLHMG